MKCTQLYCSGQRGWRGGGGVVYMDCLIIFFNNKSKIKKNVQYDNNKTHYFLQKGFSYNLQIVF